MTDISDKEELNALRQMIGYIALSGREEDIHNLDRAVRNCQLWYNANKNKWFPDKHLPIAK